MSTDISASAAYVAPPVFAARAAPTTSVTGQAAAPIGSNAASAPRPSPVSLLDPSTGLVVLEFYNAKGVETSSLPTKKALENYRQNEPPISVFQPAVHDGTVPPPSTSDKSSASAIASSTGVVQASVSVQTGSAAAETALPQPAVAASSGGSAGSFETHA